MLPVVTVKISAAIVSAVKERVAAGDADSVDAFVERAVRNALESDETAYLQSSPKNADRLLGSLARSRRGEGVILSVEELAERARLAR